MGITFMTSRDSPKKPDPHKMELKAKIREVINSRPKFKAYLKEHNLEGKLIKNFCELKYRLKGTELNVKILSLKCATYPITGIFDWSETKEGLNFWHKHDRAFDDCIKLK